VSPSRHAREDIGKIDEPKAKALVETTAGGHVDAYPRPWDRQDALAQVPELGGR
jgi:hypothetical protein